MAGPGRTAVEGVDHAARLEQIVVAAGSVQVGAAGRCIDLGSRTLRGKRCSFRDQC